jgi:hypothetical protein
MSQLSDCVKLLASQLESLNMDNTIYTMVKRYGIELSPTRQWHYPDYNVPKQCFKNAAGLALATGFTYFEGYIDVHGVPIHHAWCVDDSKQIVDPTLTDPRILDYFGIPFNIEFVIRCATQTRYYGVLDNIGLAKIYKMDPMEFLDPKWLKDIHC